MTDLSQYSDEQLAAIAGDGQPLSVRNNNPGNMRGPDGNFQQFDTPDAGMQAMQKDLALKISGQSPAMAAKFGQGYQPTLSNVISTWAPENENDTQDYIDSVAKQTGLAPDTVLTADHIPALQQAMIKQEGGAKAAKQFADAGNIATDAQVDVSKLSDADLEKIAGPEKPKGFLQRVNDDLTNRGKQFQQDAAAYSDNQESLPEATLNVTGKTLAGGLGDIIGEGVKSAASALPDSVKKSASSLIDYAANTDLGKEIAQKAGVTANTYKDVAAQYPRSTRALESIADIAGVLPASKAANASGKAMETAGDALESSGKKRSINAKTSFAQDLVLPKETPTVAADNAKRTTAGGVFKADKYNPTPEEKAVATTVAALPVSKSNTLQKNLNVIQDANTKEAQGLHNYLKQNDVPVDLQTVQTGLTNSLTKLGDSESVVGHEASVQTLVKKLNKAILNNISPNGEITASGLFQARKDFDKSLAPRAFLAANDTALTVATRELRSMINGLVADAVPAAHVRASLAKQSNLFTAADNIAPKAAKQASTTLGRLSDKITNIPLKKTIALGALGGFAPHVVLPVVAAGGGIYGATKAVRSPALHRLAGKTLSTTGGALKRL